MKNQDLFDFYLKILSMPNDSIFRLRNQALYAATRDAIAYQIMEDRETVQRIFERMAMEEMDIWFAFYNHEISLQQLKAQLKDIGWTDEEVEDGLDDQD